VDHLLEDLLALEHVVPLDGQLADRRRCGRERARGAERGREERAQEEGARRAPERRKDAP
jgi:hypothetical protein